MESIGERQRIEADKARRAMVLGNVSDAKLDDAERKRLQDAVQEFKPVITEKSER